MQCETDGALLRTDIGPDGAHDVGVAAGGGCACATQSCMQRAAKSVHMVPRSAARAPSREVCHCAAVPCTYAHLVGPPTHRVRRGASRCVPMICEQLLARVLLPVSPLFPQLPVQGWSTPSAAPESACRQLFCYTHDKRSIASGSGARESRPPSRSAQTACSAFRPLLTP
jgi:hypothetical protein